MYICVCVCVCKFCIKVLKLSKCNAVFCIRMFMERTP